MLNAISINYRKRRPPLTSIHQSLAYIRRRWQRCRRRSAYWWMVAGQRESYGIGQKEKCRIFQIFSIKWKEICKSGNVDFKATIMRWPFMVCCISIGVVLNEFVWVRMKMMAPFNLSCPESIGLLCLMLKCFLVFSSLISIWIWDLFLVFFPSLDLLDIVMRPNVTFNAFFFLLLQVVLGTWMTLTSI